MADFNELGLQLGTFLQSLDMLVRQVNWSREITGDTLFRDIIGEAFDFDTKAQVDAKENISAGGVLAAAAIAAEHDTLKLTMGTFWTVVLDETFTFDDEDLAGGAITYAYDADLIGQGQVTISDRTGFLAVLREEMIATSRQILRNTVTFGALTAAATGNQGTMLLDGAPTAFDFMLDGVLAFRCISDVVEAVQLQITHDLDTPFVDDVVKIVGDNLIQIGKSYQDGPIGISLLKLKFEDPVISGDTASVFDVGTLSFVNPTEATTDKGKYHVRVTRQTSDTWLVEIFSDSSLTTLQGSDASAIGTVGSETITITTTDGSVTVDIDKADADTEMPSVNDTYTGSIFDQQIPRENDRFTIRTDSDEAGNYATKLSTTPGWRVDLPSGAVESAAFDDARAADIVLP